MWARSGLNLWQIPPPLHVRRFEFGVMLVYNVWSSMELVNIVYEVIYARHAEHVLRVLFFQRLVVNSFFCKAPLKIRGINRDFLQTH